LLFLPVLIFMLLLLSVKIQILSMLVCDQRPSA
jgi:hypothetical protein